MNGNPNRALERRGIVFINAPQKCDFSKSPFFYDCYICGCKLRSEKNAVMHVDNQHHLQQITRFEKYFTIVVPQNSLGKVTLVCKFCTAQLTWEESKEHVQQHNVVSWIKPNDISRTFFRHFISQHKNAIFKCNLCNFTYCNWFHAMEHTKDPKHVTNWGQTLAPNANYALYENTELQFNDLTSNRIFIGKYYHCYNCNVSLMNFKEADAHIHSIEHENLISRFIKDIFEFKENIPEDLSWIKESSLMVVMKDKIYCKPCDVYLTELNEVNVHLLSHQTQTGTKNSQLDTCRKPQKDSKTSEGAVAASKLDTTEVCKTFSECELHIPDHLIWVVNSHNVIVRKKSLYCSVCKKTLTNHSAVKFHLQKHLEPNWQKKNLPPLFPRSAAEYELRASVQGLTSTSGTSGSVKRNASTSSNTEQIKIQKVDNITPSFKNVGNFIQILPQTGPNQPVLLSTPGVSNFTNLPNPTKKKPANLPNTGLGILGDYPAVIMTPSNSYVNKFQLNSRPNLVDLMKKSIPSLMNKPVLVPNTLETSLLPTSNNQVKPDPKINPPVQHSLNPKITQPDRNVMSNKPVHNNMSNQSAFNQMTPKPPLNAYPMKTFPLSAPPMNSVNTFPVNNPTNNQPKSSYILNQQTNQSTSFIPKNNCANQPSGRNSPFNQSSKQKSLKKNVQLSSLSPLVNTTIMTKLHKANYLFFTKNEIYAMSPEKRRRIVLSSQLSFFVKYTSDYFIYCVVCEKSIPYNLQNIYEHWCSSQHNEYLTKMEQDDKQFNVYPNQFSCLALSKEFMIENQSSGTLSKSLKDFTCCACDVTVLDQDSLLRQHFQSENHQANVARFRRHSEEICKEIFPLVESNWYSIEKYSCWPCQKILSNEVPYAEHLDSKKHLSTLQAMSSQERKKYYFDSCAVCGLLWFGDDDEYPKHCYQDAIHKDLTRNIEDRIDYLPEVAKNVLSDPETVITNLVEEVNRLRYDQARENELVRSLELAVRRKFPEAKAYPFGSRVTGLGLMNSDIDIFLDCGGAYDGKFSHSADLIDRIHHCLKLDSQAWNIERVIENSRTPIIKVYHSHSQLKCDVSFSNGLSVENTKLLKGYLEAYPPCKEMILFIKKWLALCDLSGSRQITNYAMSWFVIFYLQVRKILPSVASIMKGNPNLKNISGWRVGKNRRIPVAKNSLQFTTRELLKGFFSFYANFDYRFSIACPLLGIIKSKRDFLYLQLLPDEMKNYVDLVSNEIDPEFFRIDSPMCIQDPYDLSHNLTKGVKKVIVNRFRKLCGKSARLLEV